MGQAQGQRFIPPGIQGFESFDRLGPRVRPRSGGLGTNIFPMISSSAGIQTPIERGVVGRPAPTVGGGPPPAAPAPGGGPGTSSGVLTGAAGGALTGGAPGPTAAPTPPPFAGVPVTITPGGNVGGAGAASLLELGRAPVDTAQLEEFLGRSAAVTNRAVSNAAATAASQAFGRGAAGTPVQMVAGQAGADIGERLAAQEARTILDFLSGGEQRRISALGSAEQLDLARQQALQSALGTTEQLGLAREGQAFNQALQAAGFEQQALNQLLQAGGLPRTLEQQALQNTFNEFLRQLGGQTETVQLLAQLMTGTPVGFGPGGGTSFDLGSLLPLAALPFIA